MTRTATAHSSRLGAVRSACPDVLSLYLTVPCDPADPRGLSADADDPYVRHQHKYTAAPLPPERRFYFHTLGEAGTAATLEEFSRHLRHCDPYIPAYHLSHGDFSRWVTGTLADNNLGWQVAAIERDLTQHHAAALERARHQITHAIDSRYPGSAGDQTAREKKGQASGGRDGDLSSIMAACRSGRRTRRHRPVRGPRCTADCCRTPRRYGANSRNETLHHGRANNNRAMFIEPWGRTRRARVSRRRGRSRPGPGLRCGTGGPDRPGRSARGAPR